VSVIFEEVPGVGGYGHHQALCGAWLSGPVDGKSGVGVGEKFLDIDVDLVSI
jgi:hypothetical protein